MTAAALPSIRPPVLARPRGLLFLALALALLAGPLPPAGAQTAAAQGRISGRILGTPEGTDLSGTQVVLVQFRINEQGQPEGRPIQTQEADADGRYTFSDIEIASGTVYKLGATVQGRMVDSRPFTFPEQEREVLLDLRVPQLSQDSSAVQIQEGLIAVEPRRGAVWVTEVLHLVNGGPDTVDGSKRPLELSLPAQADTLEVLREIRTEDGHTRLGGKLLVYGNLEPGTTTVAFRYRLPVWLGVVTLEKRYPYAIRALSVLSPQGSLKLRGAGFAAQEPKEIDDTRYDAWALLDVSAGENVHVRLSGVPVRQEVYLLPVAGFVVLMGGVVVWFLRRRVGEPPDVAAPEDEPGASA